MEKKDYTKEYKEHLNNLQNLNLKDFLNQFEHLNDYKEKKLFLNKFVCKEIKGVFIEDFFKLFYLDSQAKYILKKFNLTNLDNLKTLVYSYNTNSREFNGNIKELELKNKLLNKGYKEVEFLRYKENESKEKFKKRKEEIYKPLDNLKIKCVFDRDKIGILGSFTEKGEYEGKFKFDKERGFLFFIPKRHTKTGQLLISKFYYKEVE